MTYKLRIANLIVAAVWVLAGVTAGLSQTSECLDEMPGHKVRSVKVKARWLPPDLSLPLKKGDDFTPEKLSETRFAVIKAISDEKNKFETTLIKLERLQM